MRLIPAPALFLETPGWSKNCDATQSHCGDMLQHTPAVKEHRVPANREIRNNLSALQLG